MLMVELFSAFKRQFFFPMFGRIINDLYYKVEVVFVSSDRSQADMNTYMQESHGDWLALAHGSPEVSVLSGMFGVRGIPALVVVTREGELVARDGRQDVMSLGAQAFSTWNQVRK